MDGEDVQFGEVLAAAGGRRRVADAADCDHDHDRDHDDEQAVGDGRSPESVGAQPHVVAEFGRERPPAQDRERDDEQRHGTQKEENGGARDAGDGRLEDERDERRDDDARPDAEGEPFGEVEPADVEVVAVARLCGPPGGKERRHEGVARSDEDEQDRERDDERVPLGKCDGERRPRGDDDAREDEEVRRGLAGHSREEAAVRRHCVRDTTRGQKYGSATAGVGR